MKNSKIEFLEISNRPPRFIAKRFSGITNAAYVHRRRHDGSFDASCGVAPDTQYVAFSVSNRMMPGDEYYPVSELNTLRPEALIEDTSAGWSQNRILSEADKKDPEYVSALAHATSTLEKVKAAVAQSAIKPDTNTPK